MVPHRSNAFWTWMPWALRVDGGLDGALEPGPLGPGPGPSDLTGTPSLTFSLLGLKQNLADQCVSRTSRLTSVCAENCCC